MAPQLLSLALLPLALASLGSASPNTGSGTLAERQARHKALAARAAKDARGVNADVHPVLGKRSLDVRAGAGVQAGGFEVVGDSGVSAQMMFVGSADIVYILDSELLPTDEEVGSASAMHYSEHDLPRDPS